jgi:hypothetical protein
MNGTGPFGLPSPGDLIRTNSGPSTLSTLGIGKKVVPATIQDHTITGRGVYFPNALTASAGYEGLSPGERVTDAHIVLRAAYPATFRVTVKMVQGNRVVSVPIRQRATVDKGQTIEFRLNTAGDFAGKVVEDFKGFRGKGLVIGVEIQQLDPRMREVEDPKRAVYPERNNPAGGHSRDY